IRADPARRSYRDNSLHSTSEVYGGFSAKSWQHRRALASKALRPLDRRVQRGDDTSRTQYPRAQPLGLAVQADSARAENDDVGIVSWMDVGTTGTGDQRFNASARQQAEIGVTGTSDGKVQPFRIAARRHIAAAVNRDSQVLLVDPIQKQVTGACHS